MILTCPECATSYFVDDSALGQGRTVRCTSCGASWRAEPETPLELGSGADDPAFGPIDDARLGALGGDALPKAIRAKAEQQKRMREAAAAGAVWAGIGAVFAAVIVSALVFRIDVVRLWPRTASAYAAVGLPVNQVGLTIEKVHAEPALQDGHPALAVTGQVRNIRTRPVAVPPILIRFLDKDGHKLGERLAAGPADQVAASQTRSFTLRLMDPPAAVKDVEVTFSLAHWRPDAALSVSKVAKAEPAPSVALRPAPPADAPPAPPAAAPKAMPEAAPLGDAAAAAMAEPAKPLPPGDPHALKPAAH